MLKVERAAQLPQEEWEGVLAGLESSPLHLPRVFALGSAPEDLAYFLVRSGGDVVAAGCAIRRVTRRLKIFRGESVLYFPAFPALAAEPGLAPRVVSALVQQARALGYRQVEFDPRCGHDFGGGEFAPFRVHSLIDFTVDLRQDLDALLRGLHKKHRKNLRLAEGEGLEVVEDPSLEAFLELRGMQESSSERAAERGNEYRVQDAGFFRATYDALYRVGPGRVLYARREGESLAALAFLAGGPRGVTVRSGSTPGGYLSSAMYLLQFELFRRLKAEGALELNIGGVPAEAADPAHPQHGLFTYKRYYGGHQRLRDGLLVPLG